MVCACVMLAGTVYDALSPATPEARIVPTFGLIDHVTARLER